MTAGLFLGVVAAGAAGAVARFVVTGALQGSAASLPWGTLAVNVAGSFALGALGAARLPPAVVAVAGTGFLGAFTTFSAFSVETVMLAERQGRRAIVYGTVMAVTCALGAAAGAAAARVFWA